jgi:site-specific DNA-adenine methylase
MVETMILKPFFRYYGGKWRAVHAGLYPQPLHKQIIEPFAGAAGYALHYPHHEVTLVDRYPVIVGIWRWLISATSEEVMSIPLVDSVEDLPVWVPLGAQDLIGFSMNSAVAQPRVTLSAGARKRRESGRKFYGWTKELRQRVADQVPRIKHWHVHEANYSSATVLAATPATWFVDPPYVTAGKHYTYGPTNLDYEQLARWCRRLDGQPIVCESPSAKWLPFRKLGVVKSGPRSTTTREAVWP